MTELRRCFGTREYSTKSQICRCCEQRKECGEKRELEKNTYRT